jgi:ribosomal protein S18 acetylase RimI-like enzyme
LPGPRFRVACAADAEAVARLHAESWRRHYRGAYADSFLDGDVLEDRLATWTARLSSPDPARYTLLAEAEGLIGFANTYLDEDARWGALLDNLHVAREQQRQGVGSRLLVLSAQAIAARSTRPGCGLYLWVLEQNVRARDFYQALGARYAGREPVTPPGGVEGRLHGAPLKLRYAWSDLEVLLRRAR